MRAEYYTVPIMRTALVYWPGPLPTGRLPLCAPELEGRLETLSGVLHSGCQWRVCVARTLRPASTYASGVENATGF